MLRSLGIIFETKKWYLIITQILGYTQLFISWSTYIQRHLSPVDRTLCQMPRIYTVTAFKKAYFGDSTSGIL